MCLRKKPIWLFFSQLNQTLMSFTLKEKRIFGLKATDLPRCMYQTHSEDYLQMQKENTFCNKIFSWFVILPQIRQWYIPWMAKRKSLRIEIGFMLTMMFNHNPLLFLYQGNKQPQSNCIWSRIGSVWSNSSGIACFVCWSVICSQSVENITLILLLF